ncbi:hypothetical protein [Limnohabitans sp. Jir72]|uniref:hypothetical protein n=1 Tax=Limnohabitans sp. Jir72 TaxID=1977909 RepID=UPI001304BE4D|nr:hypothetical protein [Limnohabitans sp. Jir72]
MAESFKKVRVEISSLTQSIRTMQGQKVLKCARSKTNPEQPLAKIDFSAWKVQLSPVACVELKTHRFSAANQLPIKGT